MHAFAARAVRISSLSFISPILQRSRPGLNAGPSARNGLGLANTRSRLEQLYGDQFSCDLRDADAGGAVAIVSLPFHTHCGDGSERGVSEPIRVVVVDDEPLGRAGLRALLDAAPELSVVGEAVSVDSAVKAIEALQPELVMLDVQMADGNGIDVIRRLGPDRMPPVVFVTAYDEFAVNAFEVNAVDYLLKPFDDERFAITMQRAKKVVRQSHVGDLSRRLADLLGGTVTQRAAPAPYVDRLVVKTSGCVFFLRTDEIDWIEAADYCVKVHGGKDTQLRPYFHGDQILVLKDGTKLKLSRARRAQLEAMISRR